MNAAVDQELVRLERRVRWLRAACLGMMLGIALSDVVLSYYVGFENELTLLLLMTAPGGVVVFLMERDR